jgi:hypothetical protein
MDERAPQVRGLAGRLCGAVDFRIGNDDDYLFQPRIYRLEGDALLLCYSDDRFQKRPVKFETREGTKLVLVTLKRQRP